MCIRRVSVAVCGDLFDYLRNYWHKNRRNKFYDGCFIHKYYFQPGHCAVERAQAEVEASCKKSQVAKRLGTFQFLNEFSGKKTQKAQTYVLVLKRNFYSRKNVITFNFL
jgi:hypothetical protein